MHRAEETHPRIPAVATDAFTQTQAGGLTPYRVFDIVLSLVAIVFLAPLFIAIAVMVRAQDGGPAIFAHRRVGLGGRMFRCHKFRSMCVDSDARLAAHLAANPAARLQWAEDHKLRNDPRITALGSFLRRSSLDELPQFLDVLRGDMSLVGPRPIVEAEAARYGRYFAHYCANKPGITGLWQVSGRNNVSYRRRVAMDVVYARRRTMQLYLRILVATLPAVVLRRGAL
jgi:lipopolysaccharide/colanic/teichoic acid biosynthesis glycosyltransferase